MERLHVMDGHGYIFRAHYGLMNSSRGERKEVRLSTAEGMPTGAVYVFARMLMRLHDDLRPERMVVVFDSGRKSFRSDIYPPYKANRPPPPEDLGIQLPYFRPLVEAMGMDVPVLAYAGGKMRKHRIRILAGDRVNLEMSPYDVTRGRINFRHLDAPGTMPARRKFPFKKR